MTAPTVGNPTAPYTWRPPAITMPTVERLAQWVHAVGIWLVFAGLLTDTAVTLRDVLARRLHPLNAEFLVACVLASLLCFLAPKGRQRPAPDKPARCDVQ